MSSKYLWKLYLENDAEAFQRLLLEGTPPPTDRGSHQGAVGGPGLDLQTSHEGIDGKSIIGIPTKSSNFPGQSLKRQKETRLAFNRQALRDYDARGRSLIHLAATEYDGIPFLRSLLRHPQLDLTYPDLESGWTALHRALYHGNITAARLLLNTEAAKIAVGGVSGGATLVKTKDHSGESPFELFYASIEGCEAVLHQLRETYQGRMEDVNGFDIEDADDSPDEFFSWRAREIVRRRDKLLKSRAGDEVFAFGSNKNLTLGFGDEDDRQFPERVPLQRPQQLLAELGGKRSHDDLNAMEAFKPLGIQDIQLSKLHSAIITSDPHNNLYTCGFGHGGRLGLGDDQLTQFTYKHVSIGDKPYSVSKVALGLDHTVVILHNGEVWTWGLNKYGQLGYATGKTILAGGSGTGNAGHGQAKNKKIGQGTSGLEEAELVQSTPRRVVDNIKRENIIGCAASRIHTVLHAYDTLYVFGKNEGQLGILEASDLSTPAWSPKKVVAGFLADHTIHLVAATDKCTAVMLETHDVWLFASYGYTRVIFPVQRFFTDPNTVSFPITDKRSKEPNYITKIATGGEIMCGLTRMGDVYTVHLGEAFKSSTSGGKLSLPAAQRIWSRKKGPMAAKDVDVDQDGSIIICTESGSVWRRVKRTKANDSLNGHSASIGAGGTTTFGIEGKSKDYKFSRVPGLTRIVSVHSNKFGAYAAIRKDCTIMQTHLQAESLEPAPDNPCISCPSNLRGLHPIFSPENWSKYDIRFPDIINSKIWRKMLESIDTGTCDMTIRSVNSDLKVPVHKAILLARCNILRKKLKELGNQEQLEWGSGMFKITINEHGLQLDIKEDFAPVLLLIIDIYALRVLGYTFNERKVPNRVAALGHALQVTGYDLSQITTKNRNAHVDLTEALRDPLYTDHGDTIIELASGYEVRVYSTLLRLKSPFFETLFKGSANGRWIAARVKQMKAAGETALRVDMAHIPWEIFQIVLDYIYSGNDSLLQQVKGFPDVDTYLDFVLDVLAVADELMLDELSIVCQKVIGLYVNTRNASQLLKAIAPFSQNAFKDMCLKYICINLETMLENFLLDDLDDWIMEELDNAVRQMQQPCATYSRCQAQEARLLQQYPEMLEGMVRERQALIAVYAKMIEAGHGREDTLQSGAHRHKATFSGPVTPTTAKKQRKKPTKEGSSSNIHSGVLPSTLGVGNEGMIDMENEDGAFSLGAQEKQRDSTLARKVSAWAPYNSAYVSPASSLPRGNGGAISWLEAKNGEPSSLGVDVFDTPLPPKPEMTPSTSSPDTPAKPWKDASANVAKLDMKEIMVQAAVASSRHSNLSLGLSSAKGEEKVASASAGATVTPSPKLSQKEKRRLQQEQQQRQHQPLPSTPEKTKSSPWATPSQGPRIVLREVLEADANKPPSSPALAALSSPAGIGSPVQMRPLQLAPTTPSKHLPASSTTTRILQPKIDVHISTPPRIGLLTPSTSTPTPSIRPPLPISVSHHPTRTQPPPPTRPSSLNPSNQSKSNPPPISSIQALPELKSASSSARVEPSLHLSLADIIEQQAAEQAFLKGKVEKRSLEDIQQEQEFMDWWDKECERIRMESESINPGREVIGQGDRRGKRGGKGSKGRGGKSGGDGNEENGRGRRGDSSGRGGDRRGRSERGRGRGKETEQPRAPPVQGIVIR
ncbi:hypothetical protein L211DRAFT_848730 [Terfezia boudieri ATCC MYA-4762]|uniref:BTB domain-containing protein n=1 Tax=Terfezia boudieri ATCC MYA-4762 TaxID=1051890 RepID=A0A3N4LNM6_9PEZI|nr:hypothetical protein L211DRAFT_848730 [Terfezia boudieri ATCC MYA-4762]